MATSASLLDLAPERRLDFWLGEWDARWGEDGRGSNRIERILDGRVIQENFADGPEVTFRGLSVSVYNAKLGRWQQTWVDTSGSYWHFDGEVLADRFIFATDDVVVEAGVTRPVKLRMTFLNIAADSMDWRWERSDDGGTTWQLKWAIHYTRKQQEAGV